MYYKNGERTYIVEFNIKDSRGYCKVQDKDTKVDFYLPEFVIKDMTYVFGWDRYREDLNKVEVLNVINLEIKRIEELNFSSFNTEKGLEHLNNFKKDLESLEG